MLDLNIEVRVILLQLFGYGVSIVLLRDVPNQHGIVTWGALISVKLILLLGH